MFRSVTLSVSTFNFAVLAESGLKGTHERALSDQGSFPTDRKLGSPDGCWMCEKDDWGCQTFDCYMRGGSCISKDWLPYPTFWHDPATGKYNWWCEYESESQYGGYDIAYIYDNLMNIKGVTCIPHNLPDGHCPSPQCYGDWNSCTDWNGNTLSASWKLGDPDAQGNQYCWQMCGNPIHKYPLKSQCYSPDGTVAVDSIHCISNDAFKDYGFCAFPARDIGGGNPPVPLVRMLSGGTDFPVRHDPELHAGINVAPDSEQHV